MIEEGSTPARASTVNRLRPAWCAHMVEWTGLHMVAATSRYSTDPSGRLLGRRLRRWLPIARAPARHRHFTEMAHQRRPSVGDWPRRLPWQRGPATGTGSLESIDGLVSQGMDRRSDKCRGPRRRTGCGSGTAERASPLADAEASVDTEELTVLVASFDIAVGERERFLAGVLTPDGTVFAGGSVNLTFSPLIDGEAPIEPFVGAVAEFLSVPGISAPTPPADGPIVKTDHAVHPDETPHHHSADDAADETTSDDPDIVGVYQTHVAFDQPGLWMVTVDADIDGRPRTGSAIFDVLEHHQVPVPGDVAPMAHSLTQAHPDLVAVDSRATNGAIPDGILHDIDLAEILERGQPAVVVFSTPTYCTSRFCGPITDRIEALAVDYGDRARFVHIEIWADIDERRLNPAVEAWIKTTDGGSEPWVFLVGADGRIAARWDNVLDQPELTELLDDLPPI